MPADRRVPFAALFMLLVLVAFSDEYLSAVLDVTDDPYQDWRWLVVPIDAVLLLIVLVQKHRFRLRTGGERGRQVLPWWLFGAAITLGLDLTVSLSDPSLTLDLIAAPFYVAALVMLVAATMDSSPRLLVSPRLRGERVEEWTRLQATVPLLVGTLGAYMATVWWDHLLHQTTKEQPNAVDEEYFAQLSQVIALLIVALGVEFGYFREGFTDPLRRAVAILSLSILSLAEVMAFSVLAAGGKIYVWHMYAAFIITVEACLIALTTMISVLIFHQRGEPTPEPVRQPEIRVVTQPDNKVATIAAAGLVAVALVNSARRRRR